MSQVIYFKTKEDFLTYCEKIWDQGIEEKYQLIKMVYEPTNYTVVSKREALKIRANLLVSDDIFIRKKTVHPIFKAVGFPFIAIPQKEIIEELRVESV